ncbi:MAG: bifunctional nuclease family protein [Nitrospira sp.]|jgi:bifunctional DNase/RNase|nr:bifunctional nuclease family protein [Nitrospira sp.]MBS0175803.1 bifunctional nuclease family protein [Nitrospira sp.]MBS0178729.1 bifunctional nuclease family protein [Nitrospira sp.]MBX3338031.1 bifunctional nuclease family protein [Nitrospira sp.]MCW5780385.1 bifunctional nuclease family protein [Nitrospira sp.]
MDAAKQQDASSELVALTVKQVLDDGNTDTRIVVLKSEDAGVTLPIWVGSAEGNAIRLAMDHVVTPRPMSHDLIRSFADHLGVRIERVVITDVKSSTYYASIAFASKGLHRTLDARPSDAIALALRAGCPIYATQDVLNRRTAVHLDAWINRLDTNNTETQQA